MVEDIQRSTLDQLLLIMQLKRNLKDLFQLQYSKKIIYPKYLEINLDIDSTTLMTSTTSWIFTKLLEQTDDSNNRHSTLLCTPYLYKSNSIL